MSCTSSVAWAVFVQLLKTIGPKASLDSFLIPCVSLFIGAVFNHELAARSTGMTVAQFIGFTIVLVGMGMVLHKDLTSPSESPLQKLKYTTLIP
jgi:hypothetical protein